MNQVLSPERVGADGAEPAVTQEFPAPAERPEPAHRAGLLTGAVA
ncbi:hypothetical protein OG909_31295 [Streptomyces sp. NBC_01754]|nr:hypothetical protein [Streptomyces sp. NBC_01754]WSC96432.1 hypothetical protein OG909_31295 [Streptomyces sp. NBC_01754]